MQPAHRQFLFASVLASAGGRVSVASAQPPAATRDAPTETRSANAVGVESGLRSYTLSQAVSEALASHPRIRAARADERAADARVDETHLSELPAVGVSAQLNRSTGNTVPGLFFSTQGFPAIAGPVEGRSLNVGTWQTGASLWASWDVLSFVRQAGAIDAVLARRQAAVAQVRLEQLEVAYGAADAFLLLLEAQEAARAAQAAVDRAEILVRTTRPLVDQTLRPGVDLSRAEAELAGARTLLAGAAQARGIRRANLAVAVGHVGLAMEASPGQLLDIVEPPRVRVLDNPRVIEAEAVVQRVGAERDVVRAQFLPRLDLVAALFARGTGLSVNGLPQSPADGIAPDVLNWAAGLAVTWSALDVPAIRARSRAATEDYSAAMARRDDVVLAISGQLENASAFLRGAESIARETPVALAAARAAEQQAVARYRTTLAPIVDVADAERVLSQAEINDAIARVEVQRALFALKRAAGDLGAFGVR